jgi:hypothetical protein
MTNLIAKLIGAGADYASSDVRVAAGIFVLGIALTAAGWLFNRKKINESA